MSAALSSTAANDAVTQIVASPTPFLRIPTWTSSITVSVKSCNVRSNDSISARISASAAASPRSNAITRGSMASSRAIMSVTVSGPVRGGRLPKISAT